MPQVVGGVVLAVGLLGGLGGWAAVARLEGAVIASGTVKVEVKGKAGAEGLALLEFYDLP